jgi:hypothetical protein
MLTKHRKKGQVAVLDLFIAALIFGIIVTSIMFVWNNYNVKIDRQIDSNTNLIRAYHISDLLTRYPGKPTAWEKYYDLGLDTVTIIGLAKDDRVVDEGKLSTFLDLDYDYIRSKLSINSYDFYFKMTNLDGSDLIPSVEKGNITNSSVAIVLKRYVIYNEEEKILEFWLQEK